MRAIPYIHVEKVIEKFSRNDEQEESVLEKQRRTALEKLENLRWDNQAALLSSEIDYLDKIIELFSTTEIITGNSEFLKDKIKHIREITLYSDFKKENLYIRIKKFYGYKEFRKNGYNFKDAILECLGYEKLRAKFYPLYFRELGLKTCVYCNSQLAISIQKTNGKLSAKFQMDHFYDKATYPF